MLDSIAILRNKKGSGDHWGSAEVPCEIYEVEMDSLWDPELMPISYRTNLKQMNHECSGK